jgi:hypothetical protein
VYKQQSEEWMQGEEKGGVGGAVALPHILAKLLDWPVGETSGQF